MQRVDARRALRSHLRHARPGRVIQTHLGMRLEEPHDGVAARALHLVAAGEAACEVRRVELVEPACREMPVDARQGEHGALPFRLHEADASAVVVHGSAVAAAFGHAQGLHAARRQLALDESGEHPLPHRRKQRVRHTELAQHVRGIERAASRGGPHLLGHDAFARHRQPRHPAHQIRYHGTHGQNRTPRRLHPHRPRFPPSSQPSPPPWPRPRRHPDLRPGLRLRRHRRADPPAP